VSKRRQNFVDPPSRLKQNKPPEDLMRHLLHDICVKLGFCGGDRKPTVEYFCRMAPVSKNAFVDHIMTCEGFEPSEQLAFRLEIANEFEKLFGERFDPSVGDTQNAN